MGRYERMYLPIILLLGIISDRWSIGIFGTADGRFAYFKMH